jgi:hypothetical protein
MPRDRRGEPRRPGWHVVMAVRIAKGLRCPVLLRQIGPRAAGESAPRAAETL